MPPELHPGDGRATRPAATCILPLPRRRSSSDRIDGASGLALADVYRVLAVVYFNTEGSHIFASELERDIIWHEQIDRIPGGGGTECAFVYRGALDPATPMGERLRAFSANDGDRLFHYQRRLPLRARRCHWPAGRREEAPPSVSSTTRCRHRGRTLASRRTASPPMAFCTAAPSGHCSRGWEDRGGALAPIRVLVRLAHPVGRCRLLWYKLEPHFWTAKPEPNSGATPRKVGRFLPRASSTLQWRMRSFRILIGRNE